MTEASADDRNKRHGTFPCFKDGCKSTFKNIGGARTHFTLKHVIERCAANTIMLSNSSLYQCDTCFRLYAVQRGKRRAHDCIPDGDVPLPTAPEAAADESRPKGSSYAAYEQFKQDAQAVLLEYRTERARGTAGDADAQRIIVKLLKTTPLTVGEFKRVDVSAAGSPAVLAPAQQQPLAPCSGGPFATTCSCSRRARAGRAAGRRSATRGPNTP